jgi:hypothetical protein
MKIIKNEKMIARNGKIGNYISMAALAVLGIGTYISFNQPQLFIYALLCLLLGFTFTQVGIYMGSRYGRSPRPDEKLDAALKGLHSEFNLFHYFTPTSHFLIGPAGAWVVLPYHQRGNVEYKNGRWRLSGGGFLQAYMRIFGQEGLGRPDADARNEVASMQKFLVKRLDDGDVPEVRALIVFTGDNVEVQADESPVQALKLKQLKEFIRRESKTRVLTTDQLSRITEKILPPG